MFSAPMFKVDTRLGALDPNLMTLIWEVGMAANAHPQMSELSSAAAKLWLVHQDVRKRAGERSPGVRSARIDTLGRPLAMLSTVLSARCAILGWIRYGFLARL